MRIAVSCSHDFAPAFGVARVVRGIERGLAGLQTPHSLVYYGVSEEARNELVPDLIERGAISAGSKALRFGSLRVLWEQLALPWRCRRDRVDLLHSPAYAAPIFSSTPSVLTVHDILTTTHPRLCRRRNVLHHRLTLRRSLLNARRIITVSEHVRHEVLERFSIPAERVVCVRPGIDAQYFATPSEAAKCRVARHYQLPQKFLLWVGHPEPKKNLGRLIEALGIARRSDPRLSLVMTGSLDESSERSSSGLRAGGVIPVGWVGAEDLPALYALAEGLVFPSLAEGWGLPVVEAMAVGTPTIASSVPSVVETDPNATVLIDPHSVDSIAAGILRLLRVTGLRASLVEKGHRAVADLTWERHAAELMRVYEGAFLA